MNETIYYVHWDTHRLGGVSGPFDFDGAQRAIAEIKQRHQNAICEIRVKQQDAGT
jgi:hypothetical protein